MTPLELELMGDGFVDRTAELLGVCLYCLFLKGELVYVGRSGNMICRMLRHRQQGTIDFDQILVRMVSAEMASVREAELIRRYQPLLNIASTEKAKRSTREEIKAEATALLIAVGLKQPPPLKRRPLG